MAGSGKRKGTRRTRVIAAAFVGVAVIASAGAAVWFVVARSDAPAGPPTAAIVDQLSVTFPNPAFAEETRATLEEAGYAVDYYANEDVTVDFYRRLPFHNYDLIIFRSHADRLQATSTSGEQVDEVILFTSEPYSTERYQNEQAANDLVIARYTRDGEPYFGVAAGFIRGSAAEYDGATIIMMGCEGLLSDRTAAAFVDRGAEVYISWDESVTATHTDAATERLLEHLVVEGLPPDDAVARTMSDVGPDPIYGSRLLAYPAGG